MNDRDGSIEQLYGAYPRVQTRSGGSFIDLSDPFVTWLTAVNGGFLNKGNLLCFDYAMAHLPSHDPIIEIGVLAGLSTNLLSYYRRKHRVAAPFFNCDRWLFEGAVGTIGNSPVTHEQYRQYARECYERNVRFFSPDDLPFTMELLSEEFFAAWRGVREETDIFGRRVRLGGSISFCFIDGNHSYEFAKRDFLNVHEFLAPGGFVLLDDSARGSPFEVARVAQEILRMSEYRVVAENPNFMFQRLP